MNDEPWYINALETCTQKAFECLPSPQPSSQQWLEAKIVGHRGAHSGKQVLENTHQAFADLVSAGVWGAEMDIRWTKDLVPVISHDAHCQRLFQKDIVIADTHFSELRKKAPLIPSLEEIVAAFGGQLHLMLELKAEPYPKAQQQASILKSVLAPLQAIKDYHFLALDKSLFSHLPFIAQESRILVSVFNTKIISQQGQEKNYAGIAGAYPFFTRNLRNIHRDLGQKIGTGHINCKRLLRRELALGTDWVFSNAPVKMQSFLEGEKEKHSSD